MLSSFLAWLRVVVLVAVIGTPARAQQNEINASPEQTTEQQGLDPNPLRRTTLTGSPCVFPVVSEGAVQTDCFTWQGQQEMCYDGTTMVACAPLTTTTEADEETRQAIVAHNQLDLALYQAALEHFELQKLAVLKS